MLKNNIEVDVKIKCIEAGKTQAQLGEMIGSTGQYVNRIIKKGDGVMNKTFVEMLDALGYDTLVQILSISHPKNSDKTDMLHEGCPLSSLLLDRVDSKAMFYNMARLTRHICVDF